MRYVQAFVLYLLIAPSAFAQSIPTLPDGADIAPVDTAAPINPPMPLQVDPPTQELRRFDKLIYVLDVSGSMTGGPLNEAIDVTDAFASDGFFATVITFDDTFVEWGGAFEECHHSASEPHTDRCLPRGWGRMPLHREQLRSHIANVKHGGGTTPGPALVRAIETAPVGALIVFVSDGEFDKNQTTPLVSAALLARSQRDGVLPQILVWSTKREDDQPESMREIARVGGGGLWRAEVARPTTTHHH